MTHFSPLILSVFVLLLSLTINAEQRLTVELLEQRAHDPKTFTQGLYWHNKKLYESSGLYGKSFIRRYDATSDAIEKTMPVNTRFFAEGLTLFNNELFLLTWRAETLLVFDPESFQLKKKLTYSGQGWGLTHNQKQLIMSNGSEIISFRDPKTFDVQRTIEVHNRWRKYKKINELEYAQSAIWANVWQEPYILKISPDNGEVMGIVSLNTFVGENSTSPNRNVLNGIAYDAERDAFWITGKFWRKRYLVRFNEAK